MAGPLGRLIGGALLGALGWPPLCGLLPLARSGEWAGALGVLRHAF